MKQKSKSLFLQLTTIVMLVCCLLGAWGTLPLLEKEQTVAKAETVEYQDLLAVENRSWGAASDEYYFGGYTIGASTENNAHWLNTDASVNGCWYNGNDALITANNGVDILQYIYVNDTSARDAITANLNNGGTLVGSNGWLTNPAASPVYVETTNGSGLLIKILKAYAGESYTLTFKAGFSLIRNDGETIYLSDDVIYNCVGNEPTRVVEKMDPTVYLEYQDLLGLEDRTSWGAHNGEYYFGGVTLDPFGYFNTADSVSSAWYVGNDSVITANNGVDIMEYIYVNGQSARSLITANANGDRVANSCNCWLSNPAASPVYVETTKNSGIIIRLLKSAVGDTVTLTFKAGFSLIRNDGEVIYVSDDINYTYANGTLSKEAKYTLTFDGVESRRIVAGAAIGELPEVPVKDGYTGVWTVDGVEITADTVYNYSENKTAVVVYTKDVTDTVKIEFSTHNAVQSTFKIFITPAAKLCENNAWNIEGWDTALIAANNGVDIMEYIYINGQNLRTLSDDNRTNNTYPVGDATGWLTNSDQCRPVFVETNAEGIWVTVLHAFSGEEYKVSLKEGFSILDSDGNISAINEDVEFICTSGGGVTKVAEYTLSFDGLDDTLTVTVGQAIGELPAVPEKEGFVALGWVIDGVTITADTVWLYDTEKTAYPLYVQNYKLSFEGLTDELTVTAGEAVGELPVAPEKEGYIALGWTIDGVELTKETIWNYTENKTALAVYDMMEYTITIVRASGVEETIAFTIENKASKLTEVTLTEDNDEYTYSWSEALPQTLELKNYTFTEVATPQPEKSKIISQSLSIGTAFTMNIYVSVAGEVVPSMQVVMGEATETLSGVLVDQTLNKYVYRLENIAADQLADSYEFTLLEGENTIDWMTYSVEEYLIALSQKEISNELKTLIADIVAYGQAAEEMAGKEDGISTIEGLETTVYSDLTETDMKKSTSLNDGVELVSAYVSVSNGNRLAVRFTATSNEGLVVKINGNEVSFSEVEAGSGVYEVVTNDLYIVGCNDKFKVTISVDGTVAQTLIYSVKSYVYEKQNSENVAEKNYVQALYNCSVALKDYAEGV